jgi:hypothetical protein
MLNFKVKSHVGRGPRRKIWCFGIVDATFTSALGFLKIVPDRTANILLPIIGEVVREGSVILSDEWPAYRQIQTVLGLTHFSVCHKENFIHPISGIHTQNVESYWNKLKMVIKAMKGVNESKHNDLIDVFLWRERVINCEWTAMKSLLLLN